MQPLLDELKDKPQEIENGKLEELKKQLEDALAAKAEAEAKLDLFAGNSKENSGKLNPSVVSTVASALNNAPHPPPMPGEFCSFVTRVIVTTIKFLGNL